LARTPKEVSAATKVVEVVVVAGVVNSPASAIVD